MTFVLEIFALAGRTLGPRRIERHGNEIALGYLNASARVLNAVARLAESIEAPGEHSGQQLRDHSHQPALELIEEEYNAILDMNLKSVFFCCVEFGRRMVKRGEGVIVNVSSLVAHTGWAIAAAYGASKWGVASITQTFAAEWRRERRSRDAITPRFFLTDLNPARCPKAASSRRARTAMKRMGELAELVGAAVVLASDAARFIDGATLRVDGGYLSSGI